MTSADPAAILVPRAVGDHGVEPDEADHLVVDSKCADVVPTDRVLDDLSGFGNQTIQSVQGAGEWTLR